MTSLPAPALPRFHLAVPVDDLDAARLFYGDLMGCVPGRSADRWQDWNLYGHQLVTHLADARPGTVHNPVDEKQVPVPHFGVLLPVADFHELARRLTDADVQFVIEPYVRFAGESAEQWTMFFRDPAGNAIEIKAFADDSQVFAGTVNSTV